MFKDNITLNDFKTICENNGLINWSTKYKSSSLIYFMKNKEEYGIIENGNYVPVFGFRIHGEYTNTDNKDNAVIYFYDDKYKKVKRNTVLCKTTKEFSKYCKDIIIFIKSKKIRNALKRIDLDFK